MAQGTAVCLYVPFDRVAAEIIVFSIRRSPKDRSGTRPASENGLTDTVTKMLSLGADVRLGVR